MEWKPIDTAPSNRDLELAVIDSKGTRVVTFPCRRLTDNAWIDAETGKQLYYMRHTLARLVSLAEQSSFLPILLFAHLQDVRGGMFNQSNVSNS
jgi:hypothetical protein